MNLPAVSRFAAVLLLSMPVIAQATNSVFSHGYGQTSEGAGGVGVVLAEDSGALAANPAVALAVAPRWDLGTDIYKVSIRSTLRGNAAGDDARYRSDGQEVFIIPQGGFVARYGDRIGYGATLFAAGLGTDYPNNPYQRFGGSPRGGVKLGQSILSSALAYALTPRHTIGVGINLAYQSISVVGIEFLGALSVAPQQVSNQGREGAFGYGAQLGYRGQLADTLTLGLSWRSRTNFSRFDDYRGLLPDGDLDMPTTYNAGLMWTPVPVLALAFEAQRAEYSDQKATGHRAERLAQGEALGSPNGPGFGWRDQTVLKFGAVWTASPQWTLRAGYSRATQLLPPSETFLGMMAPLVMRDHVTAGLTWRSANSGWDYTAMLGAALSGAVDGRNSIPPALGGGEADGTAQQRFIGLAIGRRF